MCVDYLGQGEEGEIGKIESQLNRIEGMLSDDPSNRNNAALRKLYIELTRELAKLTSNGFQHRQRE